MIGVSSNEDRSLWHILLFVVPSWPCILSFIRPIKIDTTPTLNKFCTAGELCLFWHPLIYSHAPVGAASECATQHSLATPRGASTNDRCGGGGGGGAAAAATASSDRRRPWCARSCRSSWWRQEIRTADRQKARARTGGARGLSNAAAVCRGAVAPPPTHKVNGVGPVDVDYRCRPTDTFSISPVFVDESHENEKVMGHSAGKVPQKRESNTPHRKLCWPRPPQSAPAGPCEGQARGTQRPGRVGASGTPIGPN
eukprot:SAG31_NODE_202_length_20512_cov_62.659237_7_plen_254_part_00